MSDSEELPYYGVITGVELPCEETEIADGVFLRTSYASVFSAPMIAFNPPKEPEKHHPPPWIAVRGGTHFESIVEVCLETDANLFEFHPRKFLWLLTSLVRLKVTSPVRLVTTSHRPKTELIEAPTSFDVSAFEYQSTQFGVFSKARVILDENHLNALREDLPALLTLFEDERFNRAFSIYEQAQWSTTLSAAMTMIWTSLEILFGISNQRDKTRALSGALSEYVTDDRSDRDRAYQVIQSLAKERGRSVHAGREPDEQDVLQAIQFSKAAFSKSISDRGLPDPNI
jgi:hypothetical protein